jgi:hypothetical protein
MKIHIENNLEAYQAIYAALTFFRNQQRGHQKMSCACDLCWAERHIDEICSRLKEERLQFHDRRVK